MLEANDGDERSYLEIAEVIEERSDAASAELVELWRRIALSVLISHDLTITSDGGRPQIVWDPFTDPDIRAQD